MMSPLRVQKLVETLVEGEEDLFANGLSLELTTRKNDLCSALSVKIFEKLQSPVVDTEVELTEDIKHFLQLLEEIEQKNTLRLQFKNASILNISEAEVKPVKYLFDNLNSTNQKALATKLFESPQSFKQIIEFAKKVKGLF
jgi:hypothetical protein